MTKKSKLFTLNPDNTITIHKGKARNEEHTCKDLHKAIQYAKMR